MGFFFRIWRILDAAHPHQIRALGATDPPRFCRKGLPVSSCPGRERVSPVERQDLHRQGKARIGRGTVLPPIRLSICRLSVFSVPAH